MANPNDTELLPPSGAVTRGPALGSPELSTEYLARIKENLEVLLGRRGGSDWDRAVTFRDLHGMGWQGGAGGGGMVFNMAGVAELDASAPGFQQFVGRLSDEIMRSTAFKSLKARIGSAESNAHLPDEIKRQLQLSLLQVAREHQAAIETVENKIQTSTLSMASRLKEITASLERTAAGVREFDVAYADRTQAIALKVTQLAASLEGAGSVELEERFQAIADEIDGLQGQWSIKIQALGPGGIPVIAGIALAVEDPIAGPGTSSLIFMAERFGFVTENGTTTPFVIVGDQIEFTGNVRINGQLVIGPTGLQPGFEAPDTKNSDLAPAISAAQATADAMAGLTLVGRNATVTGNSVTKTGGTNGLWDADCHSVDAFTGGAYVSFVVVDMPSVLMIGLNASAPSADSGFTDIDYAFYLNGSAIRLYIGGVDQGYSFGYAPTDVLSMKYDDSSVAWMRYGTELLKVPAPAGLRMFVDSSLNSANAKLKNIQFGPLSSTAAGVAANAAIPGINADIADKLNKNAADTLAGRVALQANGSIVAGDLAFDVNGNRTSGSGSGMNQKGFVHYSPDGNADVVINAAGVAVKGDISGSNGTFFGSLRTGNYAEDSSGNTTAGAKLDATGTALKVASGGLQVGALVFTDYWTRIVRAIDGDTTSALVWRGNNDATTRGGAPNAACLTMYPMASQIPNGDFQQAYWRYRILPTSYTAYTDNLDAMTTIRVRLYQATSSTTPFVDIQLACGSRTYNGTDGAGWGALHWAWRNNVGPMMETNGVYSGHMRCNLINTYGASADRDFGPGSTPGVALPAATIVGAVGAAGGGSTGGACPAPWVKVSLLNGVQIAAGDLTNGMCVAAVNDDTLEPIPDGGAITDVATIWAQRYRVKLNNGSAPEFSGNHRLATVSRGWVAVQKLRPGDHIIGLEEAIVESVLAVGEGQVVSFRVTGAGTYFSGGLLCHNAKQIAY